MEYLECSKESALDREEKNDSDYWLFAIAPDKINEDVFDKSLLQLEGVINNLEKEYYKLWNSKLFAKPR